MAKICMEAFSGCKVSDLFKSFSPESVEVTTDVDFSHRKTYTMNKEKNLSFFFYKTIWTEQLRNVETFVETLSSGKLSNPLFKLRSQGEGSCQNGWAVIFYI